MANVAAVCISEKKGTVKTPKPWIETRPDEGIFGDAHAKDGHRQVSLLAQESVDLMRKQGIELSPGDFAENILTEGIELHTLPVGTKILVGEHILLEVTQIGKKCHSGCAIARQVGTCIMPSRGIFARVLQGGKVQPGDEIRVVS